ncbi:MAG: zf-HC2 domain-containing protein [Candidatus Zixiibacteriota bacterium]|nr:MAG: zf-HC2 domain-containing protein [candidate division Zixibacteria bacterium]
MNCQDALDLLYDIIDREASEIDAQQVKEHLDNCRDCFEVYRLEQSVQDFINEKIQTPTHNPRVEELRAKIISQLDEIDRESPTKRETRFFRLTTRTLVAAASLVILIGASFLVAAFYRHDDLYIPLERAHWDVTKNIDAYQNGPVTQQLLRTIEQDHLYTVSDRVLQFDLLGGKNEQLMDATMSHMVYKKGDKLVSVFFVPDDQYEISSDLEETRVVRNNLAFFDHNCRGCRLVFHRIGSLIVIAASTERDIDLLDFVPGLAAI